ncbi:hypothetical protein AHF37_10563 [Paragonimus kellicotti]|nr:hypothetical protein AHF37_10563 [Paragonimus kellicotti]
MQNLWLVLTCVPSGLKKFDSSMCSICYLPVSRWLASLPCLFGPTGTCQSVGKRSHPLDPFTKLLTRHSSEDEVRLLLVADPHVQLYHTYWYYGEYFALMDSDRYLRRYFRRVRRLTEPDAILILGDLVDGDNIVSNDIFLHAAERVKQVFISSHPTPCFVIPGDNDIGGEGDDPITDQRTERFKRTFGLLSNSQHIRFVHLHGNTPWNKLTKPVNLHDTHVTILLSHIPDISSQTVIDLEPDILISGHDHMVSALYPSKLQH